MTNTTQNEISLLNHALQNEDQTIANERDIPEEEVNEASGAVPTNQANRLLNQHRNIVNQGPADPDANKKRFAARAGSWAIVLSPSFAAYAALGKCFFDVSCMSYAACAGAGAGVGAGTALVLTACMKCGPADCCCELAGREYDDQQQTTRYNQSTSLLWAAGNQRNSGATQPPQPKTFCCLRMP
ncbi:MAG: hypothetical protein WC748_00060 [Legionellales bacterium]|jgi:hypothetical protein